MVFNISSKHENIPNVFQIIFKFLVYYLTLHICNNMYTNPSNFVIYAVDTIIFLYSPYDCLGYSNIKNIL